MKSGKLDKSIKVQHAAVTVGAAGQQVETWNDVATVRAEVIQGSTQEFIRGYGASEEAGIVFRVRWLDGITTAHRVIFGSVIHDIKELKEIGRRRGLEIRTYSTGKPETVPPPPPPEPEPEPEP